MHRDYKVHNTYPGSTTPPPTLFIDIPLILVSFSPKLCTVQLTIEKMLLFKISYFALPMKPRPPGGEFVVSNNYTFYTCPQQRFTNRSALSGSSEDQWRQ